MPKVLNARDVGFNVQNAVYVGRPSDFGNPFSIKHFSREQCISKFEKLVEGNEEFKQQIKRELVGKDLICWCAPFPCHADVLLRIANQD